MFKNRRLIHAVALAAIVGSSAQPAAAQTVQECYDKVLSWCTAAMDGARWYEKFAIGELCVALLAGCVATNMK